MESRGKGVRKLLIAAGVIGLISGVHAQEDGDALAPDGAEDVSPYEDTGYDVYEDDAAYGDEPPYGDEPAYGDEEYGDDAEIFGDGDDGFIEEDAYADAPEDVADPYAEDDLYADAPEDEADPYAEDDLYADAPGYLADPYQGDDLYANAPGYVADPYEEEDQNADPYAEDDPYAYGPGEVEGPEEAFVEGPVEVTDVQGPAAGPEEVAGVPSAAGELTFEGFAAYPGSDYVPAFENLVLSQNIDGQMVADQDGCAAVCAGDPMCNAASFYLDATPYGGNNCWTKTLGIPCELPSDALMDPNAILLLQETECDPVSLPPFPAPEPEMVEAPMATLPLGLEPISAAPRAFALAPSAGGLDALSYYAYAGFDYVPQDTPPNLVSVTNTPDPGSLVMDMVECAMKCDTTIGCNAASYYAEPISGNNCWLKTLGDPCELPADRQADAGATLLMKQDTCPSLGAIAPAAAPVEAAPGIAPVFALEPGAAVVAPVAAVPIADAPMANGLSPAGDNGIGLDPPTETLDGAAGPASADSTAEGGSTVAGEDASSAAGMLTAVAVVVAAAAAAVLA